MPPRARAYREPRAYGYARPRLVVPVIPYPHRYYAFRPHFWIGFGLYSGWAVPYPLMYGAPTYVYPSVVYPPEPVLPTQAAYGGLSLEVEPGNAVVSVDGVYVGIADDFSPTHQPLTLTPGRHHVELQAEGMPPIALDVDIVAGEVVPFRGTLQPY